MGRRTKPRCERKPPEAIGFHQLTEAVHLLHLELRDKADEIQRRRDKYLTRLANDVAGESPPSERRNLIGDGLIFQHSMARREQTQALNVWCFLDKHHRRIIELIKENKIKRG